MMFGLVDKPQARHRSRSRKADTALCSVALWNYAECKAVKAGDSKLCRPHSIPGFNSEGFGIRLDDRLVRMASKLVQTNPIGIPYNEAIWGPKGPLGAEILEGKMPYLRMIGAEARANVEPLEVVLIATRSMSELFDFPWPLSKIFIGDFTGRPIRARNDQIMRPFNIPHKPTGFSGGDIPHQCSAESGIGIRRCLK